MASRYAAVQCLTWVTQLGAQAVSTQKPDFSGAWEMDVARSDGEYTFHSQKLEIRQTEREFSVVATYRDTNRRFWTLPWDYKFDGWFPRRGERDSKEPLIQARWDGDKIVALKAPGTSMPAGFVLAYPTISAN